MNPDTPDQQPAQPAADLVYQALLGELRAGEGDRTYWAERAVPYQRRHLGAHAHAAGRYDQLATDPGYLTHADPPAVLADLRHARSEPARRAAAVYRTSAHLLRTGTPEQRQRTLELDAARFQDAHLHAALGASPQGLATVVWATGSAVSPAQLDVLAGHTNWVSTVACTQLDDRPIAVTASHDHTVRIWDLTTGHALGPPLTGHTNWVSTVACTQLDNRPIAVTASTDATVRIWDLTTGHALGPPLTGHTGTVRAVACTQLDDRPIAVTGSTDNTVRIWDLTTGHALGPPLTGHTDTIIAVACTQLDNHPIAVTGSLDRTVRIWDLTTGHALAPPLTGHTGWVNAVACTQLDDRPIAVTGSDDGTVQIWDLTARTEIDRLHLPAEVRDLAVLDRALVVAFGPDIAMFRLGTLAT